MARISCGHTFAVLTCILLIIVYEDNNISFAFSPSEEWQHSSSISHRIIKAHKNSHNVSTVTRDQCGIAVESRIDCARDRSLSRAECESRGCCYLPLPRSGLRGPPWCFYTVFYPGYKMGPLLPTERGQSAILTRLTPSYLPRDIHTLQLDVMAETLDRLHLRVSNSFWLLYKMSSVFFISRDKNM